MEAQVRGMKYSKKTKINKKVFASTSFPLPSKS